MNKVIILIILVLIQYVSYAQTIINVDSSNTINIYNNGTLIENNQGTVNIGTESGKDEELRMPDDLGKVTEPKDKNIHFIYTDDYKFAGDKVKIEGKVYRNINILKSITGEKLFKVIGSDAYGYVQNHNTIYVSELDTYIKDNVLYVSKYVNCNDEYTSYYMIDGLSSTSLSIDNVDLIGNVVVDYETTSFAVFKSIMFVIGILVAFLFMLLSH